jgi:DNA adenine methylase
MSRRRVGRPVLKWAGGKTQLLGAIVDKLPAQIDTYYEPFVGGAAVFFALATAGRFKRAVLSDRNPDLIDVYRALADDAGAVVRALRRFKYDEEEYYRVREQRPRSLVQRAARMIYLNKTGYNGLYRVNRSGQFNVPFGRYKNPKICDEHNLLEAGVLLAGVRIEVADFEEICGRAEPGDAVYLDPPYVPVSKTANFTAYDRHAFGYDEQRRLAIAFEALSTRGVHALLSNSDTPFTRELYAAFERDVVPVPRPINSRPGGRGPVPELLVRTRAISAAAPGAKPSAALRSAARRAG